MAEIKFYGNIKDDSATSDGQEIGHAAGSGLGFYGSDYGISVPIGTQQTTTWITNADGTATERVRMNNTALATTGDASTAGKVSVNGGGSIDLNKLPNYLCPLNIRFTHTEAVKVQNCKLRIFDRNDISKHASGVTTHVYEARHPSSDSSKTNLAHRGAGRTARNDWVVYDPSVGTPTDMNFTDSPGASGLNTNSDDTDTTLGYTTTTGAAHENVRHDWYLAISSEPDTIGSKTKYGLYFTVEYL